MQYMAKPHTTGGQEGGKSRSSDGRLEVKASVHGAPGAGTNPEQLFDTGWSACFISAIGLVARKMKVKLPAERAVDAEADLCLNGGYALQARHKVSLPGLEREVAKSLVDGAQRPSIFQSHARQYRRDDQCGLRPASYN